LRLGVSPRQSGTAVTLVTTDCGLTAQSRGTRARAARAPHCERLIWLSFESGRPTIQQRRFLAKQLEGLAESGEASSAGHREGLGTFNFIGRVH